MMTIAGVAFMCGPVLSGAVAQDLGVRTPFIASGVIGLLVGLLLLRVPEPAQLHRPATHRCARRCGGRRSSRR